LERGEKSLVGEEIMNVVVSVLSTKEFTECSKEYRNQLRFEDFVLFLFNNFANFSKIKNEAL
jgi:hypothetical protein